MTSTKTILWTKEYGFDRCRELEAMLTEDTPVTITACGETHVMTTVANPPLGRAARLPFNRRLLLSTADSWTAEVPDEPEVSTVTDVDRTPDPRAKLKPFAHPYIAGDDVDPECGHKWRDHQRADAGSHGLTICPVTPSEVPDENQAPAWLDLAKSGDVVRDRHGDAWVLRGNKWHWLGGEMKCASDELFYCYSPITPIILEGKPAIARDEAVTITNN